MRIGLERKCRGDTLWNCWKGERTGRRAEEGCGREGWSDRRGNGGD